MDGSGRRQRSRWGLFFGLLATGACWPLDAARAQTTAPAKGQSRVQSENRKGRAKAKSDTDRRGANDPAAKAPNRARPQNQKGTEPSPEYRESLRRTVERRRQRRAGLAQQQQSSTAPGAVGAIVPWPMPPALIIRQTPDVHDEIGAFLTLLRR
jgi:hypothetical protein